MFLLWTTLNIIFVAKFCQRMLCKNITKIYNVCNQLEAVSSMVFPFTKDISRILSGANNDR